MRRLRSFSSRPAPSPGWHRAHRYAETLRRAAQRAYAHDLVEHFEAARGSEPVPPTTVRSQMSCRPCDAALGNEQTPSRATSDDHYSLLTGTIAMDRAGRGSEPARPRGVTALMAGVIRARVLAAFRGEEETA